MYNDLWSTVFHLSGTVKLDTAVTLIDRARNFQQQHNRHLCFHRMLLKTLAYFLEYSWTKYGGRPPAWCSILTLGD